MFYEMVKALILEIAYEQDRLDCERFHYTPNNREDFYDNVEQTELTYAIYGVQS